MSRFNDRQNYNNYERDNFGRESRDNREENNFDRMYDSREYSRDYRNNDYMEYPQDRASRPYSVQDDYASRENYNRYNEPKHDPARPYNNPPRGYSRRYEQNGYEQNRDYGYRNDSYKSSMPNNYNEKYAHNYTPEECNRIKNANEGENKVVFCTPRSYEDIQKLIDSLKKKQSLIVDVDKIDARDTQRYLDFLSGAIYALNGSYQKIDNKKFYFAPQGVSITIPYDLRQKKDEK